MRPYLLQHLVERASDADGDGVAIVDRDTEATYGDLEATSNQLANLLVSAGVRPGDRVGLYLDKSIDAVIALYGVLKAAAVYVPLDVRAPTARTSLIAADCGIRCLLTSTTRSPHAADVAAAVAIDRVIVVDGTPAAPTPFTGRDAIQAQSATSPPAIATSPDLAYILYTSGSTGAPKGVKLSHRNALAFVDWAVDNFGIGADDRLSNHAPLHFDLSVFDLFGAAMAGAATVLVPPKVSTLPVELARFIDAKALTVWYSVPSVLTLLVERGALPRRAFPSLRAVLFAGEVFPTRHLRHLMSVMPHARFSNLYGPTETNVCTWYDVAAIPDSDADVIPIGRPIADVDVFAVTDEGRRAAVGESGELYVRGATVTSGYWGDPVRSATSIASDEASGRAPAYRTGDIARVGGDGCFYFLGRRDSQIKTRGHRVELGEIEAVLSRHPAVVDAVAVAVPDDAVTNRIAAYVAVREELSATELRNFCGIHLPRYMTPDRIDVVRDMPRTSTGKADRQAVTEILLRAAGARTDVGAAVDDD